MQRTIALPAVAMVCIALLSACGLKGPLYQPGERAEANQTEPSDPDKLRRPRPAPQVQKEEQATPTASDAPVTPPDPERPTPSDVQSMPADESR